MKTTRHIGERIKTLRTGQKLSQEALAKDLGVSRVAVTKWEAGDTKNLKLDNLIGLSTRFRLSIDELVTGVPGGFQSADGNRVLTAQQNVKDYFRPLAARPVDEHPAITEVVSLLYATDELGKGMVLQHARAVSKERARRSKANKAS